MSGIKYVIIPLYMSYEATRKVCFDFFNEVETKEFPIVKEFDTKEDPIEETTSDTDTE